MNTKGFLLVFPFTHVILDSYLSPSVGERRCCPLPVAVQTGFQVAFNEKPRVFDLVH